MSEVVHENRSFKVERYESSHNGKSHTKYRIVEPDVAVIIPMIGDDAIVVEKQYRYAINAYLYELPAGHIEIGETPEAGAARELAEETGYRASKMSKLANWYASPAYETKRYVYFLAEGLTRGSTHKDDDEDISVATFKLAELLDMMRDGRLADIKTVAGIMLLQRFLSNRGFSNK